MLSMRLESSDRVPDEHKLPIRFSEESNPDLAAAFRAIAQIIGGATQIIVSRRTVECFSLTVERRR